jgi:hypothetical protein
MQRRLAWYFSMFIALVTASCASAVRESARAATPEAVNGTLETAHKPENRQQLAEILGDPQIGIGAAKLTEAVASGVVQGLTNGENWKALQDQSRQFAIQLGADLTRSVARELRPEIVAIVEQSVDRAMSRILSEETEQRAASLATALTRAVMKGIGQELASVDIADVSTTQGAAALARQMSRGATLGAQDAVRETKERSKAGAARDGDILADAGQAVDRGADLLSAGTLIPTGIALVALAGLVWALYRTRQFRRASEENAEAARILTQAMQADPSNSSMQALRQRIDELNRGRGATEVPGGILKNQAEPPHDYTPRQHQ